MLFISFFKWWYTDGFRQRAQLMSVRLDGIIDYFSIDLLVKTLFQPFRQDSSGKVDGPLSAKLRAVADNLISRILGAIIRLVILLFGLLAIAFTALMTVVVLVLWAAVPVLPFVGIILASVGVAL